MPKIWTTPPLSDVLPRRRYLVRVAYDGALFHGWQRQIDKGGRELPTVQGELEATLQRVLRAPRQSLGLLGASRTDAGVHALGQAAHFDAATTIPLERLCLAINSRLRADIELRDARVVPDDFDVIRDAASKQYRYRIWNAARRPLGLRHQVYYGHAPLDIERMNDAAARLTGTHDVEGLAAASHGRSTTVRTIFACHVERHETRLHPPEVHVVVSGSGFLYHMVRIIAGTLFEVGRGKLTPEVIDRILATRDRRLAGPTLPARGLCLEWIRHACLETTD